MQDLIKMPNNMFQSLGQYHILQSMTVGLFYILFSVQYKIRENGIGMFHYHFDGQQGALRVLKMGNSTG